MLEQIRKVVATEIAPYLAGHGGGLEILELTADGTLKVKLVGSCSGCPASQVTMESLVTAVITQRFPDIKRVMVEEEPTSAELLEMARRILNGGAVSCD